MDNVEISVWQPIASKQLKIEHILSLKTAQERPFFKDFATQYSTIMGDIRTGEIRLSQLSESSQAGVEDISTVLESHKDTFATEIESCSKAFENIFNDTIENELQEDITGSDY